MKHTPEEIKNRLSNIGEAIGGIALEYIAELEKENKELPVTDESLSESCEGATMMYEDLCKAKEIIAKAKKLIKGMNKYLSTKPEFWSTKEMFEIAELSEKAYQFVKECEE